MIINKKELNRLLEKILKNIEPERKELIKVFQNKVWMEEIIGITEEEMNIYNTLAYDLDFYEPNKEWRKEDAVYFGENKLMITISEALEKLGDIKTK